MIGEQQDEAVKQINAYFNSITNLQGSFEQIDPPTSAPPGASTCSARGRSDSTMRRRARSRSSPTAISSPSRKLDLKTVEKYPIESTPFRLLLDGCRRSGARCPHRRRREPGRVARDLARGQRRARRPGSIKLLFDSNPELKLKQWLITDAQGLTTKVTVNDIVAGRKVGPDFFTSKERLPAFPLRKKRLFRRRNRGAATSPSPRKSTEIKANQCLGLKGKAIVYAALNFSRSAG